MDRIIAQKRMMFIKEEDYNYLIYNLILLLNELRCVSYETRFKDFRKIAYLIDFITTDGDISNDKDSRLTKFYLKAQTKKILLSHTLIILKKNKIIDICINNDPNTFDIWLIKENIIPEFFDFNLFDKEKKNLRKIIKDVKRLKIITLKKFVNTIFKVKNVLTWEV